MVTRYGPRLGDWFDAIKGTGGCLHPIRLTGSTTTYDAHTNAVLDRYDTRDTSLGFLMTACGNRRASVCPACSQTYQDDTFHLIRAGLAGDDTKNVPASVRSHPRLFVTLTAPSFGPVRAPTESAGKTRPCRARRDRPVCPHGRALSCPVRHDADDPRVGQPLCIDCFDYTGAVLFNAHAPELWRRFTIDVPRKLAALAGLTQKALHERTRFSFAKVAEFQARGLVHFHAIVRLDGHDGPDTDPPAWLGELFADAVEAAARSVRLTVPDPDALDDPSVLGRALTFGEQLDIRTITNPAGLGGDLDEDAVAAYVAKYATKAAESTGTVDRTLRCWDCGGTGLAGACPRCDGTGARTDLDALPVTAHVRRLIATCWTLGALPVFEERKLRKWAHMLGFAGHFSTKSRKYSTTLGALRGERARYQRAESWRRRGAPEPEEATTLVVRAFRFTGSGLTDIERDWARGHWEERDQRRRDAHAIAQREAVPA